MSVNVGVSDDLLYGQRRTQSGNRLTCRNTDTPFLASTCSSCLQRPIGIAAVLDAQDDDFMKVFPDAVQDPISTSTRRPHPGQVITQRLANPGRLFDQCGGQELDDSRRNRLR